MSEHVVDYLLTDEFVAYSQKIAEIHANKKAKTEELKQVYATIKKQIEELDQAAVDATMVFEEWKSQKVKKHESK